MNRYIRNGILFAVLSATGYGFFPIFTKLIYRYSPDFTAVDIAGWRFLLTVPLVWLMLTVRNSLIHNPNAHEALPRWRLMGLGCILAIGAVAAFYGLDLIDASLYVMLFRMYPVLVVIFSLFLGERLSWNGWLALSVVMVGVALMVYDPNTTLDLSSKLIQGTLVALVNAVVIALYTIGQGRLMQHHRAKARAAAWTFTGTLFAVVPLVLWQGLHLPHLPTLAAILGLVIFSTILPLFCIYQALERIGASRFVIVGSLEPFFTLIWAYLLLGERFHSHWQIWGGVCIVGSVLLLEMPNLLFRTPKPVRAVSAAGD
ncbi:MAG: DMT family transporter [Phototrophicaceae bacterium]|jgi:drug/metabolite transporter (DMT)-like permease